MTPRAADLDADLRQPERHAGAIALIKHPIRQLAAEVRPFIRIDARQLLAAPNRRHPEGPPEQRMPTVGDYRESKTVCRMSSAGPVSSGTQTPSRRTGPAAALSARSLPARRRRAGNRPGGLQSALAFRPAAGSCCGLQQPDHLAEKPRVDARPDPDNRAADLDLDRRGIGADIVLRNDRNKIDPKSAHVRCRGRPEFPAPAIKN